MAERALLVVAWRTRGLVYPEQLLARVTQSLKKVFDKSRMVEVTVVQDKDVFRVLEVLSDRRFSEADLKDPRYCYERRTVMAKYRNKPFDVEAIRFDGSNWVEMVNFCGVYTKDKHDAYNALVFTPTWSPMPGLPRSAAEVYSAKRDAQVSVNVGDWVVKLANGFEVLTDKAFKHEFEVAS